jgi:hypothetical protein
VGDEPLLRPKVVRLLPVHDESAELASALRQVLDKPPCLHRWAGGERGKVNRAYLNWNCAVGSVPSLKRTVSKQQVPDHSFSVFHT